MSRILRVAPILATLLLFFSVIHGVELEVPSYNVVIVAIDTLRADHVGCYGYDRPVSPAIDRLAESGTRFDHAISTAPWTLPSFASMFTGLYPSRHGAGMSGEIRSLSVNTPPLDLSDDTTTIAEIFRDTGSSTAAFVSNPYMKFGLQQGFDEFRMVHPDSVANRAIRWLEQHRRERLFLLCHFNGPHQPTNPTNPQLASIGLEFNTNDPAVKPLHNWGRRGQTNYLGTQPSRAVARPYLDVKIDLYDGMVRATDDHVGRVLQALEDQGLRHNTLVVVLSDHGEEFLDHLELEKEANLDPRNIWGIGHGHSLFGELTRVPLILSGPGVAKGITIQEQFSLVDLMPTILGYVGAGDVPEGIDGRDRRRWIADPDRPDLAALSESLAYGPDLVALSDGERKAIAFRKGMAVWSFDTKHDPTESSDLIREGIYPGDLIIALDAWEDAVSGNRSLGEPIVLDDETTEKLRALGYID